MFRQLYFPAFFRGLLSYSVKIWECQSLCWTWISVLIRPSIHLALFAFLTAIGTGTVDWTHNVLVVDYLSWWINHLSHDLIFRTCKNVLIVCLVSFYHNHYFYFWNDLHPASKLLEGIDLYAEPTQVTFMGRNVGRFLFFFFRSINLTLFPKGLWSPFPPPWRLPSTIKDIWRIRETATAETFLV